MPEEKTDPRDALERIASLVTSLRKHDANGSYAAADLLEAALSILLTPSEARNFSVGKLKNEDCLRLVALQMRYG